MGQRMQTGHRAEALDAVGDHLDSERGITFRPAVGAGQHARDLPAELPLQALDLGDAVPPQPGLVAAAQARRAPAGEDAQGDAVAPDAGHASPHAYLRRLTNRISRRRRLICRSVSSFFLSLNGLSPSLN